MINKIATNLASVLPKTDRITASNLRSAYKSANVEYAGKSEYDYVTISDEAKKLAEGYMPTDEELLASQGRLMSSIIAQGGFIGRGGAMINIGTDQEPVFAVVRADTISIAGEKLETTQGLSNIPESTMQTLKFAQQLVQNEFTNDGADLQTQVHQIIDAFASAFEELSINPDIGENTGFLENAFKHIAKIVFADSARASHLRMVNVEQIIHYEKNQAGTFADVFLANFQELGVDESFVMAWGTIQPEQSE